MAEFHFTATTAESCRILQSILDLGDIYAVEEYTADPTAAEHISRINEVHLHRWHALPYFQLHLFGPYSSYPPRYAQVGDRYCVRPRVAGPSIGMCIGPPKNGLVRNDSSIFIESFYEVPDADRLLTIAELAPVRAAYAEFVKVAKKFLVRHQLKDSEHMLWIGKEACELLESGQLCLGWGDRHYSRGRWYSGKRPKVGPLPSP